MTTELYYTEEQVKDFAIINSIKDISKLIIKELNKANINLIIIL